MPTYNLSSTEKVTLQNIYATDGAAAGMGFMQYEGPLYTCFNHTNHTICKDKILFFTTIQITCIQTTIESLQMSIRFKKPQMTKRMIDIILVMIVLTVIGPLIYRGYQNYNGYCRAEKRYLTDQEKIHSMIEYIINYEKLPVKTKNKGTQFYKYIPFKNVDDFIQSNPDCCALGIKNIGEGEIMRPSFWDKFLWGSYNEAGRIHYNFRYIDEKNQEKMQSAKWRFVIQNCGTIREAHY